MACASFTIAEDSAKTLHKVVQTALDMVATNLHSLMERPLVIESTSSSIMSSEQISQAIQGKFIHLHGQFDKEMAGTVRIFSPLADSLAFAGYLRMLPDEVVGQNCKAGEWSDDDDEAMKEVGNVLFSALDEVFSGATTKNSNIRIDNIEPVEFKLKSEPMDIEPETYVVSEFSCKVADFDANQAWLLIPLEAAEELNGTPLEFAEASCGTIDDDIEDAPVRGELVAYLNDVNIQRTVRRACRRSGLSFNKRPRNEVPNPAAHNGKIVLLEIDADSGKRFDWCKRLKISNQEVHVVILLLRPNKLMVATAFKAKADCIVGWPIEETLLAEKLSLVFEAAQT
ncbi:MAG: hypothetical protein CSA62_10100 [Planctomycetota bacterium]|nr:MAG: hypothetical protein CSA62_10100 [Planctomycetota bacterium]